MRTFRRTTTAVALTGVLGFGLAACSAGEAGTVMVTETEQMTERETEFTEELEPTDTETELATDTDTETELAADTDTEFTTETES